MRLILRSMWFKLNGSELSGEDTRPYKPQLRLCILKAIESRGGILAKLWHGLNLHIERDSLCSWRPEFKPQNSTWRARYNDSDPSTLTYWWEAEKRDSAGRMEDTALSGIWNVAEAKEKSKLSKMEDENQLQKVLLHCTWICSGACTAQSSLAFAWTHCEI